MVNSQNKQFIILQENSYFLNNQKIQPNQQIIVETIFPHVKRVNDQGWSVRWVFANQKTIKEMLINMLLNSNKDLKDRINKDIVNMQTNMYHTFRRMKEMGRWCSLLSSEISLGFKLDNDFVFYIFLIRWCSCFMLERMSYMVL